MDEKMSAFSPDLTLQNDIVRLEPLQLSHATALAAAAADGALWNNRFTWIPEPGREAAYIQKAFDVCANGKGHVFAVIDCIAGSVAGTTRFYAYEPENARVMVGFTWYAMRYHGSKINPATKLLMLRFAFEKLKCGAVEFQVDNLNEHSLAAVRKLGAKQDGVLRNHKRRRDGTLRDTASFSITDKEWPGVEGKLLQRIS